ncbi:MAG: hypothetical protein CMN34_00115 [Saprospirales bacterium]|nr:hypothetical protein [Saprospirales bacterium]
MEDKTTPNVNTRLMGDNDYPAHDPRATKKSEGMGYKGREFSYASPKDPWFKRWFVRFMEWVVGRPFLYRMYRRLNEMEATPQNVWGHGLDILNIKIKYDEDQLDKIPPSGPTIVVANHPFGLADGGMLGHLVTRKRDDFFILVNEIISRVPLLKGHMLPVEFSQTEEGKKINQNTKDQTTKRLNNGDCLIIFPGGGVATRSNPFKRESLSEYKWRYFICDRIHEAKCTVVPMYFHGENSFWFHFGSWIHVNLRMSMLLRELKNKRNKTLDVTIGDPIPYSTMEGIKDKVELINYIEAQTMRLRDFPPKS